MNSLTILPPEHPFIERLRGVGMRLALQQGRILDLKQKIVDRLLAWQENPEATKIDGVGTFVLTGVRERLEALTPEIIATDIEIDAHSRVLLQTETGRLRLGDIRVPYSDPWTREEFINKNCLADVERMTFNPESCTRYTDSKMATLESAGGFQFDENDAEAARIAMTADYVGGYIDVARVIHQNEEPDRYRDKRAIMNLQSAFQACEWLERNLPTAEEGTIGDASDQNPHMLKLN